ncbi:MAG: METTL5 family protein [Thermoplasmataceae archaeon]
MKARRVLERELSRIPPPLSHKLYLEQYVTDVGAATELLFMGFNGGGIAGKRVIDLGAGNGILSIGAILLGAESVTAVEVDPDLAKLLAENVRGYPIEVLNEDVSDVSGHWDTAIMNPPWGSQSRGADRPFMDKATAIADNVYSIHNYKSVEFLRKYYSGKGRILKERKILVEIPKTYRHHEKDKEFFEAVIFSVTTVED